MILLSLELENYRQYRSERIEFPERGIIGVVGANGVGKTTLFEAIEWALYAPREIPSPEVPPRGVPGRTKVTLRLFDPRDGATWVVERGLNRSGTTKQAEVYREDNPSQPVVQGTTAVTAYVAGQLIGLSRAAFISTFFTRQKELGFFGALSATERRREVSRLLGLEVIRSAQSQIGEERSAKDQDARGLGAQVDRMAAERDFEAEGEAAERRVVQASAERDAALVAQQAAAAQLDAVRGRLSGLREQQGADHRLGVAIVEVDGKAAKAREQQDAATAQIAGIDRKAEELRRLEPVAEREPTLAAELRAHESERERHQQAENLRRVAAAAAERVSAATAGLRRIVDELPAGALVPDWQWRTADGENPALAAERLARASEAVNPEPADRLTRLAAQSVELASGRDAAKTFLDRCDAQLAKLDADRATQIGRDDLGTLAAERREALDQAKGIVTAAQARLGRAGTELDKHTSLRDRLKGQRLDEPCPTCGRPFDAEDLELTIDALAAQTEALAREIEEFRLAERHGAAEVQRRQRLLDDVQGRVDRVREIDARLENGRERTAEAVDALRAAEAALAACLAEGGFARVPAEAERARLAEEAALLQRVGSVREALLARGDEAERAVRDRAQAVAALEALGPVAYDSAAHETTSRGHMAAKAAVTQMAHLARDVAARPEWEARAVAAAGTLATLAAERDRLVGERAANGYDPAVLARAEEEEAGLHRESRERVRSHHAAESALAEALGAVQRLRDEQTRFTRERDQAMVLRREADDLGRMYTEFDAFERYVAGQLGPRIAETAGELIERITAGKYSRVDLDENYGVRVFAGEEAFPIGQFSGGERDVFALAARLALSRVVGGQALNRPRFLVLDEVFGSLDQERRRHVLDVLCRLTQENEDFRQLFIVSHVEDVVESELMDQIWRVSEQDGTSRVDVSVRNELAEQMALASA